MMKTFCGLKDNMCTFYESDGDPPPNVVMLLNFITKLKRIKLNLKNIDGILLRN
jgi:hypothetical protein